MYEYKMVKMTPDEYRLSMEMVIPGYAAQGWRLVQIIPPPMVPKLYVTLLGLPLLTVQCAWWKLPESPHFTLVLERPLPNT